MLQISTTEQMTNYLNDGADETVLFAENVNMLLDDGQMSCDQTERLESAASSCGRLLHLC